jgi:hypothetical protein
MPCGDEPIQYDPYCAPGEGDGLTLCSRLGCSGEPDAWINRVFIGDTPVATIWNGASWAIDEAATQFHYDPATADTGFLISYDIAEGDADRWHAQGQGKLRHDSYTARIRWAGLLGGADVAVLWTGDAFSHLQGHVRSDGRLLGVLSRAGGEVTFEPVPACP